MAALRSMEKYTESRLFSTSLLVFSENAVMAVLELSVGSLITVVSSELLQADSIKDAAATTADDSLTRL